MVNDRKDLKTSDDLYKYYASKNLVATTSLGINHHLFSKRRFDYCIVDESSQMALPVCLGPLRYAKRFILVGDQYQLPPLFGKNNSKAEPEPSLFSRLCQANPEAIARLNQQYRMNSDIMALANYLVYDYKLNCGNDSVANAQFEVPFIEKFYNLKHSLNSTCTGKCWIRDIMSSSLIILICRRSVVFVNTDAVPALETHKGPIIGFKKN
jgi:DNA replication ATP-dependent helicase Dna2